MRNIAEFTNADGRRVGLPTLGGLLILDVTANDKITKPDGAKTLVRYLVQGSEGARIVWLRDPFRQVISLLPVSICGPWAHCEEADGSSLVFPRNSIAEFEEIEEGVFRCSLAIPTGPVEVRIKSDYEALKETVGFIPDMPAPMGLEERIDGSDTGEDSDLSERRGAAVEGRRDDQDESSER